MTGTPVALTHERLTALLRYDPATGNFTRLVSIRGGWKAGEDAGCEDIDTGYVVIRIDGVLHLAHRLAWFYMTGEWPKDLCDHKNQRRSDNRWENLREATSSQNLINSKMWKNNTSGVKGVWLKSNGKWEARIKVRGKRIFLGLHATIELAAAARRSAEVFYFGDFAEVTP